MKIYKQNLKSAAAQWVKFATSPLCPCNLQLLTKACGKQGLQNPENIKAQIQSTPSRQHLFIHQSSRGVDAA